MIQLIITGSSMKIVEEVSESDVPSSTPGDIFFN